VLLTVFRVLVRGTNFQNQGRIHLALSRQSIVFVAVWAKVPTKKKLADLAFIHQFGWQAFWKVARHGSDPEELSPQNLLQPRFLDLLIQCGPLELPVQAARRNSTVFASGVFPCRWNRGMIVPSRVK
jgi:hypothetical protein